MYKRTATTPKMLDRDLRPDIQSVVLKTTKNTILSFHGHQ